jgi:hypothetical protein
MQVHLNETSWITMRITLFKSTVRNRVVQSRNREKKLHEFSWIFTLSPDMMSRRDWISNTEMI